MKKKKMSRGVELVLAVAAIGIVFGLGTRQSAKEAENRQKLDEYLKRQDEYLKRQAPQT